MSVTNILTPAGFVQEGVLDITQAPFTNYVSNPLTTNLNCATVHSIDDASRVRTSLLQTDQITTIPGSLQLKLIVNTDTEYQDAKSIFFNGDAKIVSNNDFVLDTLPVAGSAYPNVIGYDTTTGKCYSQPAGGGGGGTVNSVSAGNNISVTGTASDPVVNLAISGNVDMNGQQITDCGNITLVDANLNLTSAFFGNRQEIQGVRAIRSEIDQPFYIQARGTSYGIDFLISDYSRARFNNGGVFVCDFCPQTPAAPNVGNDICNKTYVDGKVGSVSAGTNISVSGTATAPVVNLAIAAPVTLSGNPGAAGSTLQSTGAITAPIWVPPAYGSFFSSSPFTYLVADTSYPVPLTDTTMASNISIVDTTKITFAVAGNYKLNYSPQLQKTGSQWTIAYFYLRRNGITDEPNSSSAVSLPSASEANPSYALPFVELWFSAAAGDYMELMTQANDTDITMTYAAAGTIPAIPSIIVNVSRV